MKLILFFLLGIALPTHATIFETQIEQTSPQVGDFGEFRLWLPPSSHPDRILVVVWGSNQCSLGIVNDPVWEEFAGSINCALLACFFYPQTPSNHWDRADEGSGAALLEAIRSLASTSGESQLTTALLYLVGDSQGGQFAFSFASWQPARTLGFVSLKGGQHDVTAIHNAAGVPGLFFAGELDAPFRIANIEEVFSKGRTLGAPWCLAIDLRGNHSPDRCGPLVRSFLRALSRLHLGREGQTLGLSAEPDTRLAAGAISSRSWFPEAAFERDWVRFESGVSGSSSPPLGFESKMPPSQGTVSPAFQDVGFIESGEKSHLLSLDVTPNDPSDWEGVSVLFGRWKLAPLKSADGTF
jgi:hypothetical protein